MTNTVARLSPVFAPVYSLRLIGSQSISTNRIFSRTCKQKPLSTLHRSRIARVIPKQRHRLFIVFGSLTNDSKLNQEEESKDSAEILNYQELLVEFSCKSCGERTKRLINRMAYERGIVFV